MHSLRIKMSAITIVAILVSILVLGWIGVYTVSVESDQSSTHEMNLISDDEKKSLDTYLFGLEHSVEMVANIAGDLLDRDGVVVEKRVSAGGPAHDKAEALETYLAQHSATVQEAFTSVANNTDGVVTYYYCINPEVGKPEDGFFFSKVGRDTFEKQPPLDATTLDPNDLEHYTWYFTPIERGEACWLGPYRAHFLDEAWTVSYVTPIYKDGVLLGVLGMDILFDTMVEQLSSIKIYKTGFVSLLDSDARILYHPLYETGSKPEVASQMLTTSIFQQDNSSGELIRYVSNGEERQLAFSTLVNGMKLVVIAPVFEITASQRHLTQIIVFVAVLLLVFFTVFTMVFTRAVTRPLLRLTAASQKLADGDYDVELDYRGNDEVGVLTESFARMRDKLRLYIGDLNARVSTDALTGIKNKGAFDADAKRLDDSIAAMEEGADAPEFGIVMFDCNRLKAINDEHGHQHGDDYLRCACRAICRTFAHSPVYRLGGDEFAVLLEGQDYANRDDLLNEFARAADEHNAAVANPWEKVDVSLGMAVFDSNEDASVEQVLHRADELMYLEKRLYKLARTQS